MGNKTTGGMIDLDECFLSANVKIKNCNVDLTANTQFNTLPWVFRTWFQQTTVWVNGISLDVSDLHNPETSYIKLQTCDSYDEDKDIGANNIGYFDTLEGNADGHVNMNDNKGLVYKRTLFAQSASVQVIDKPFLTF